MKLVVFSRCEVTEPVVRSCIAERLSEANPASYQETVAE